MNDTPDRDANIILFPGPTAPAEPTDVAFREVISDELAVIVTDTNELWLETPDRRVRITRPSAIGAAIQRARQHQRQTAR